MSLGPPSEPIKNVLVLVAGASLHVGTVADHVAGLKRLSRHHVSVIDSAALGYLDVDLSWYDVLVLHYSVVLSAPTFVPPALAERIHAFAGLKVAFIQDEYRWVDRQNEALRDLGVHVVFTVTNPEVTRKIYRSPWFENVRFEHTLTGFTPRYLCHRSVRPLSERPIDVSYRARRGPAWYGAFAAEKCRIADRFVADAARFGLTCDIDTREERRVYGEAWLDLIADSKAVLGTESGVSFIDFAGDVQPAAEAYEAAHPEENPDDIRAKFLGGRDGEIVISVISPRVFEAAAMRTLMIHYPGAYSGVMEPWRHYVPLAKDHSNMDEVVSVLRDVPRAQSIVDAAYEEVALDPRWDVAAMCAHFDRVVDEEVRRFDSHGRRASMLDPATAALNARFVSAADRARYADHVLAVAFDDLTRHHQALVEHHNQLVEQYQGLAGAHQTVVGALDESRGVSERLAIEFNEQHNALSTNFSVLNEQHEALSTDFSVLNERHNALVAWRDRSFDYLLTARLPAKIKRTVRSLLRPLRRTTANDAV
jgi:hypothetical protein